MSTLLFQQREFHKDNRKQLRQLLAESENSSELIVISANSFMQASADRAFRFEQDSSFYYLTGINDPEVILVMDGSEEYLIVPERSPSRITFEGQIETERMLLVSGVKTIMVGTEGWERLGKRLKALKKVTALAPPPDYITSLEMFTNPSRQRLLSRLHELVKNLEVQDLRPSITALRMVKSDYELKMISQAISETITLFEAIERHKNEAAYEHELLAEVNRLSVQKQLVYAYDPIIASGANAMTLHYSANNSKLDKEGMLLLDIGLKYKGYPADISRTISFHPTKRQQAVYSAVLEVHKYAISVLKPGVTMREYESAVLECMGRKLKALGLIEEADKDAVRRYYPHSTSHFMGLDVHDVADYDRPLEPGMVLTVEPGIYIREENIGIRLEDDVHITRGGNEILTDALPKNLASLTI